MLFHRKFYWCVQEVRQIKELQAARGHFFNFFRTFWFRIPHICSDYRLKILKNFLNATLRTFYTIQKSALGHCFPFSSSALPSRRLHYILHRNWLISEFGILSLMNVLSYVKGVKKKPSCFIFSLLYILAHERRILKILVPIAHNKEGIMGVDARINSSWVMEREVFLQHPLIIKSVFSPNSLLQKLTWTERPNSLSKSKRVQWMEHTHPHTMLYTLHTCELGSHVK
jgi:hypothetical protein